VRSKEDRLLKKEERQFISEIQVNLRFMSVYLSGVYEDGQFPNMGRNRKALLVWIRDLSILNSKCKKYLKTFNKSKC